MYVLILFFVWIELFFLTSFLGKKSQTERVLITALLFSSTLVAMTELLSLIHQLNFHSVFIGWMVCAVVCGIQLVRKADQTTWPKTFDPVGYYKRHSTELSISEKILLGLILIMVALELITALMSAPNNWDSLSYHLPRVMHWMQQASVEYYPSNIVRQLYLQPFAEYVMTHVMLLTGNDQLVSVVQWFCSIHVLFCVKLLTNKLTKKRNVSLGAVALAASIPMGILQSSSTQNDYVVTLWFALFVYYVVCARNSHALSDFFWCGVALGLGFLTKGTMYLFSLPFLVWMSIDQIRYAQFKKSVLQLSVLCLPVGLLNIAFLLRNFLFSGNPFYEFHQPHLNGYISLGVIVTGILKNTFIEFWTPLSYINQFAYDQIVLIHQIFHISLSDPRLNWLGTQFHPVSIVPHEDFASNPLHLFLIIFTVVLICRHKQLRCLPNVLQLTVVILCSFFFFASVILWSPWNSRYLLPIFVLLMPLSARVIDRWNPRWLIPTAIMFLIISFRWVLFNDIRPLITDEHTTSVLLSKREREYFTGYLPNPSALYDAYNIVKQQVIQKKISKIGIICGETEAEYLAWIILRDNVPDLEIEHVGVTNESATIKTNFDPQLVLYLGGNPEGLYQYRLSHQVAILKVNDD